MEQKSRVTVDFSTFQVEVEDMSRSSRATLAGSATSLSFIVFNEQGTSVFAVDQNAEEDNFGKVQMDFETGNYTMVAVAHNGDANAKITSTSSAILPGETFTDTFTKVQALSVQPNQDCRFTMNLNRITSAFILKITDVGDQVPNNVAEIEVEVNTDGSSLSEIEPSTLRINPGRGFALENLKLTYSIPVTDLSKETPFYFIGTTSPTTVTVKATAKTANGTEIISHTIGQIPLIRNQKTKASGKFFTPKVSGTFTIETWDADHNIEY